MALKPKDNSECVFSRNIRTNDVQGLLTVHTHPVYDGD